MITSLHLEDGSIIQEESQIRETFLEQMKGLLGREQPVMQFQPMSMYSADLDLNPLVQQFNEEEIYSAVKQLGENQASGPDGIPNEFMQCHWTDIKGEVVRLVQDFFDERLDLVSINRANIILVPKKETPQTVHDYRPISVINAVPKLISKLMANRLRRVLPDLISPRQTAFIKDRQITENFNATREVLQHLHKANRQAIFAKLDFKKAFDSVSWAFLESVLKARGFHPKWIRWTMHILATASSRVVINGKPSDYFRHRRGLHQGDPLSPMLFNLASDVLQRMIAAANSKPLQQ